MNIEKNLLLLIRKEICGIGFDEAVLRELTQDAQESIYNSAVRHDVAHVVGQALSNQGLLGGNELSKKYKAVTIGAYAGWTRLHHAYQEICRHLEEHKIPFLPLKGAVLRDYYPEPWLRNSCDIDILVKPEMLDQAVAVLEKDLGYANRGRGDHDVSLFSPSGVHLELHFDTMEDWYAAGNAKAVLSRVWESAIVEDGWSYRYRLPDALFYFYHIAHMAKHFQAGGCGVRPFLDIWVLNHRMSYDKTERLRLLEEGGLMKFAVAAECLSEVWFSGAEHDQLTRQMELYVLFGGVYGNQENRAAVGQAKAGGKLRYLLFHRVFVSHEALKAEYPILEKHKWLTPFYQPVRWSKRLLGGRMKNALGELRTNALTSKGEQNSVGHMLQELGIS